MNVTTVDHINNFRAAGQERSTPQELRDVATKFEALLLTQLTSALNKTSEADPEDGEENLFGGDGGTGLAKQMFSEQLATTMAQSGGVGLSDVILRQLGGTPAKLAPGGIKGLLDTVTEIRDLNEGDMAMPVVQNQLKPLPNNSPRAIPLSKAVFNCDPNEAQVISTFENEIRTEGIDDSLKNLILDGKVVNTTRPRLAPNAPVRQMLGVDTVPGAALVSTASALATLQMPVNGRISSGFGNRFHPIDKKIKFHAGVDLAVPLGTPVEAAAAGKVSFAGWTDGYGNLVVIQHPDGRETRYGHLEKLLVGTDTQVSAGQEVGLSGSTGKSTGPHVHFEVRENGQVVDPIKVLAKGLPYNAER